MARFESKDSGVSQLLDTVVEDEVPVMSVRAEETRVVPRIEVVDSDMVRVLREKTPAERLAVGAAMWRLARDMLHNLLRAEHPDWSEAEIARETARRLSHGAV